MVDMRDLNGSGLKLTNHTWGLQTKTPCMRVAAGMIWKGGRVVDGGSLVNRVLYQEW